MSKKNKRNNRSAQRTQRPAKKLTGTDLERAVHEPLKASFEAIRAGHSAKAETICRDAIKRFGRHPRLFSNLAVAVEHQNRPEDALRVAEVALETFPEDANLWNVRGAIKKFLGDLDGARTDFAQAIELAPRFPGAWRNHAGMKRYTDPNDPDLPKLQEALEALPSNDENRSVLYFALARAYDQIGETDRAFELFERGNRSARRRVRFNPQMYRAAVDETLNAYDENWFSKGPVDGASDADPILIVGMPRSGSSLIEQILSSHPEVTGLGEVRELPMAIRAKAEEAGVVAHGVGGLIALDDKRLAGIANRYARGLRERAQDEGRPTDKYLTNYMHVGLLARIMPKARIIDARREPRDNAWGCYKVSFTSNVPFSYDWEEMALTMKESARVMDTLSERMPGSILKVQYEDVVGDLEGQTRRMLDFLGLPWNDACLRFHENERQVNSASALQVREPLFKSSLGAWRPYEKHLGPMMKALEAELGPLGD